MTDLRRRDRAGRILINERMIEQYERGEETLRADPLNFEALRIVGAFGKGCPISSLYWHDVRSLKDLEDWSAAELMNVNGIGRKGVETIQTVMGEHGLSLHPDREIPIQREDRYDREKREARERAEAKLADDWVALLYGQASAGTLRLVLPRVQKLVDEIEDRSRQTPQPARPNNVVHFPGSVDAREAASKRRSG